MRAHPPGAPTTAHSQHLGRAHTRHSAPTRGIIHPAPLTDHRAMSLAANLAHMSLAAVLVAFAGMLAAAPDAVLEVLCTWLWGGGTFGLGLTGLAPHLPALFPPFARDAWAAPLWMS